MVALSNKEYEEGLIGEILLDGELIHSLKIKSKHFHFTQNRIVFEIIEKLRDLEEEINVISVNTEISKSKDIEILPSQITNYIENRLICTNSIKSIENQLIKLYERREAKRLLIVAQDRINHGEDVETILNSINKYLDNKVVPNCKSAHITECLDEAIYKMESAYKSGGKNTGMETGFKKLDEILNGFEKPCYTIIGARPGTGKTAFSLELANRLSQNNKVIYFSLEMPMDQLGQRLLANKSKVPLENIKRGKIDENAFQHILKVRDSFSKNNLMIIDEANVSIEELARICRNQKRKNGLDCVIVDYFTLLKCESVFKDERVKYNYVSEQLRIIAKQLEINIIALSQLSRSVDLRNEIYLSDLRETGNLEQDANVIMFLNGLDSEDDMGQDYLDVLIKKNRNGENNVGVKFKYYKRTQILEEI